MTNSSYTIGKSSSTRSRNKLNPVPAPAINLSQVANHVALEARRRYCENPANHHSDQVISEQNASSNFNHNLNINSISSNSINNAPTQPSHLQLNSQSSQNSRALSSERSPSYEHHSLRIRHDSNRSSDRDTNTSSTNPTTDNITAKISKLKESNNMALKLAMDAKNNALKKRLSSNGSYSEVTLETRHDQASQVHATQGLRQLSPERNYLQKSISSNSNIIYSNRRREEQHPGQFNKGTALRTLSSVGDRDRAPTRGQEFSEIVPVTRRPPEGFSSSDDSDQEAKVSCCQ